MTGTTAPGAAGSALRAMWASGGHPRVADELIPDQGGGRTRACRLAA